MISKEQIDEALRVIRQHLTVEETVLDSHKVTLVTGFANEEVIRAVAVYAVACVGEIIQTDLSICTRFLGHGADALVRLRRDVSAFIKQNNAVLTDHERENVRDPWIVECMGHLFLSLSRLVPALSPPGELLVLLPVHDDVKDHGIDLAGLHLQDPRALGMSIGEAKTSQHHAQKQLSRANRVITEVETAERDMHLRRLLTLAYPALPEEHKELAVEAVWLDNRAYLPIVSYAEGSDFDPTAERPLSLGAHNLDRDRIRLIALQIENYPEFFNSVSDAMRTVLNDLENA